MPAPQEVQATPQDRLQSLREAQPAQPTTQDRLQSLRESRPTVLPGNYPEKDGSNVLLSSFESDGRHYAIPTMWDGEKGHTGDEAWTRAQRLGLEGFPSFESHDEAETWIEQHHGNIVGDGRGEPDPGPTSGRRLERLLRRSEDVGFGEAFGTTATGRTKGGFDYAPYAATARAGADWVTLLAAGTRYDKGEHSQEDRERLEDYFDWNSRERTTAGGVGGIVGEAPAFMLEFATGAGILSQMGKQLAKTAGGKTLARIMGKWGSTRLAGALEQNVVGRTVAGLAKGGTRGLAIGAVNELAAAPGGWGRTMANVRRLQFQRRFDLSEEDSRLLVTEVQGASADMLDVLPQAIIDQAIEFSSEGLGASIPFVAKLDALQDSLVSLFLGKVGVKEGRKVMAKAGFNGVWAEIGEEYVGAAAREAAAAAGGEGFQELGGSLRETFESTLELYLGFGILGGAGRVAGAGIDTVLGRPREMGSETDIEIKAGTAREGELLSEEDLETLEALRPEDIEMPRSGARPDPGSGEAVADEEVPDGGGAAAQRLTDLVEEQAFSSKGLSGLDVERQNSVAPDVLAVAHDPQVFDAIVRLLPVEVVDMLAREKLSPEMLLHDPAVLEKVFSTDPDVSVPALAGVADALVGGVARAVAEVALGQAEPMEAAEESLPAEVASTLDLGQGEPPAVPEPRAEEEAPSSRPPSIAPPTPGQSIVPPERRGTGRAEGEGVSPAEAGPVLETEAGPVTIEPAEPPLTEPEPTLDPERETATPVARPLPDAGDLGSPAKEPATEGPGEPIGNQLFGSLEGEPQWQEDKPISAPQVVKSLSGILAAAGDERPIRVGRIKGRFEGIFKRQPNLMRLRVANDIGTAAHEVAHALEQNVFGKNNPWVSLPQSIRAELSALGRALYGERKPSGGYMREGWAEFVRIYVTEGTEAALKAAPELSGWFESTFLRERTEVAAAIKAAQTAAAQWREQGSKARASASIVEGEERKGLGEVKERVYDAMVDELGPLFRVTKDVEERLGRQLRPSESPALAAKAMRRIAPGRLKYMVNRGMLDFAGNVVGPALRDSINLVRGQKQDFTLYLWARRSLAMLDDPKGSRNPGLSREDANQLLKELDGANPKFSLAAKGVYQWLEGIQDYAAQSSPTYAKVIDTIRKRDPGDYIPVKREFAALDGLMRGQGSVASGSLSKRLKGSGRRVKDIFPQLLADAERTILKSHQRFVLERILDISKMPDMGHIAEKLPPDMVPAAARTVGDLLDKVQQRIEAAGGTVEVTEGEGDVLQEVVTFFAPAWNPKSSEDPVLPVVEEGKIVYYSIPAPLYRTLEGLDTVYLNKAVELFLGIPARTFRIGTTGLRASFGVITNPLRDVQALFFNTRSASGSWDVFGAWFSQMFRAGIRLLSGGTKVDEYTDAFLRLGVEMAQPLSLDTNYTRREAKRLFKGRFSQVVNISTWPDLLREAIQFPETAPRTAEMRLMAKELGWEPGTPMSLDQALALTIAGKESTTDFTAAGSFGKMMNRIVPFFNAQIQGPRVTAVRTSEHLGRNILRGIVGVTMPTMLLWYLFGDDDWYVEMPAREKARYWNVPIGDELIQIPRAFEIGYVFGAIPELLAAAADPRRGGSWREIFGRIFSEGVPQLASEGWDVFVPPVLPVPAKIVLEQALNENLYWGSPIVSRSLKRMPAEEQFHDFTPQVAVAAGQILGVSPERLEHVIAGLFGGIGRDAMGLLGTATDYERVEGLASTPVLGRLFRRGGHFGYSMVSVEKLYDLREQAEMLQASRKHEETSSERTRRLLLSDTTQALSAISFIRARTPSMDDRKALTLEMLSFARDALQEIEKDRPSRGRFTGEKKRRQREKEQIR